MPMKTRQPDGTWKQDPIKDYSDGAPKPAQASTSKVQAQRDALAETLRAVQQCKNITQVRKCLEHGRQTYPR